MQQKELVEFIAQSLVDNPEEVVVREVEGEQTSVLELSVAKEVELPATILLLMFMSGT